MIVLEEAFPSNNELKGMHWHTYRKLRARLRDIIAGQSAGLPKTDPCWLRIERHSAGRLDWDNAYGGLKPIIDCLVDSSPRNPDGLGLIGNDDPSHMPDPPFLKQVKAKRGQGRTVITIAASPASASIESWRQSFETATPVWRFEIPEATPSNNIVKDMHWMAYRTLRLRLKKWVFVGIGGRAKSPVEKPLLLVERHSAGRLDWDNAYGGLKPLLDCLVLPTPRNPDGLGLLVNDDSDSMPIPPYVRQVPAKRGAGKTVVTLFSA